MRLVGAAAALAAVALVPLSITSAAVAEDKPEATGEVVVFSNELLPLDRLEAGTDCQSLPPLTHVVNNLTDQTIVVYHDPDCTFPMVTLLAGRGSHASGAGSYKVAL